MIVNVHERVLAAPVERVGALLDGLGGPDDRLWPSPAWTALRLDGPMRVGAVGRFGAARFLVTAHDPGRSVEFTFGPDVPLRGTNTFTATPLGPDRTLLRHDTRGRPVGVMRLVWPAGLRALHDAFDEDLLDRAQDVVGDPPARRHRHSRRVRLLRRLDERDPVRAAPVPRTALLEAALPRVDWSDAWAVARRPGVAGDPRAWVDAVFHGPPGWGSALLGLRDAVAEPLGFGASAFPVVAEAADEVLVGGGDRHLEFRASVLVEADRVVLSTVVRLHDAWGRAYFAPVSRVHPVVVRSLLARAARRIAVGGPYRSPLPSGTKDG